MKATVSCLEQQARIAPQLQHEPEVFERIMSFRMPEFTERLVKKQGMSPEEAEKMFCETLRFLYLCRQGRKVRFSFAPSPLIDEGWHNFILFTKVYQRFCEEYIGRFIHHQPLLNGESNGKYRTTYEAAVQLFGSLDPNIWPVFGTGTCQPACAPGDPCGPPEECEMD